VAVVGAVAEVAVVVAEAAADAVVEAVVSTAAMEIPVAETPVAEADAVAGRFAMLL
jgi:hypothetical protein